MGARLTIKTQLTGLALALAVCGFAFAAYAYVTLETVRVNGPYYRDIVVTKDLIADVVPRADLTIATKAGVTRTPEARVIDCSRAALLRQLDSSLRSLGTDYVDLWYVHWVDDTVPFEETLGALDAAVGAGKARYVGVSNYCGWRVGRAAAWQRAIPGRAPIIADQVRYSLIDRGVEREVIAFEQVINAAAEGRLVEADRTLHGATIIEGMVESAKVSVALNGEG